jgi:hypothetical protein
VNKYDTPVGNGSRAFLPHITHYQRIVVALSETIRLMAAIDQAIPGFSIE